MMEEKSMEYRWPKTMAGEEAKLLFGGDYNPDQWPEAVWEEDVRLMKKAKVNVVTVAVFAWANLEPEDGIYTFEWLDRVLDKLYEGGIAVDLATATATPPRWLTSAHPEILPRNKQGEVLWPGSRQQWRPTSEVFRRYALRLAEKMAERYKNHPALVSWHVSNELGCHNRFDYSDDAALGFQKWLKNRYGSLEALNDSWNGSFWSQKVTDWSQIIPPRESMCGCNPTTLLDFKRFSSDALLEYYKAEAALLHRITPDVPVTTNLMIIENQTNPVDCFKWGRHLDFVSNDHYYLPDERHLDEMTMSAAITDGVADKNPWFLMENSTSSVNWRPINLRKQPGEIIRDALVHVANGADAVCFFQWRQSCAGAEKFHSALLPHAGADSRLFREVCELGNALTALRPVLKSRVEKARIAMIYDYDSWWSWENGLLTQLFDYRAEFYHWYRAALDAGVAADIVRADDAWESYQTVMFPVTILTDAGISEKARRYVEQGGQLIVTYGSGIMDSREHVYLGGYPGAFRELLGVRVEEFVAIDQDDTIRLDNGWSGQMWADDITGVSDDCEIVARILPSAKDRALRGQAIVTCRSYGKGSAWYIGTKLDRSSAEQLFREQILKTDAALDEKEAHLLSGETATGKNTPLWIRRVKDGQCFEFIFNRCAEQAVEVPVEGKPLYLLMAEAGDDRVVLEPSGAAVYCVSEAVKRSE